MAVIFPVLPLAGALPESPLTVESAAVLVLVLAGFLVAALLMLIRARAGGADRSRTSPGNVSNYARFLRNRDGAPDLRARTLQRREAFFSALAASPVSAQARVDRAAYRRNLRRRRPESGLDARVLWLLATAKANQSERFGVGLAEVYGRVPAPDEDAVRVHLHLQEFYHTRILADVVALFGLSVHAAPPPLFTRALIKSFVFAPPQWVMPGVGFGEMVGCVLFRMLRDRGVALFAGEPAVAERIRLLYDEILGDEISHVGYCAAQMGATGRRVMMWLYRWFGMRLVMQMPELRLLFDRAELKHTFENFDLDVMAEEVGGKAHVWSAAA